MTDVGHPAANELIELRRRFGKLEDHFRCRRIEAISAGSDLDRSRDRTLVQGHATPEGSRRLQSRFAGRYSSFHHVAQNLAISSIGIGTSRGAADAETDAFYVQALNGAMVGGINLVDTSINYRFQRSEVAVGSALRNFVTAEGGNRDEIIVCSKGGYLVPGAFSPQSIPADEVEAGFHSIAGAFLADQVDRSIRNTGLGTIDVYYIHNPEVELPFIGRARLHRRLATAFEYLEQFVSERKIMHYGIATWKGFNPEALSLAGLAKAAVEIGGEDHHFRFVQLPYNEHMQGAATSGDDNGRTLLEVAEEEGITVIASAALAGARGPTGERLLDHLIPADQVARRLQFVRSTRGITSALVGMRRLAHVEANLAIAAVAS